MSNVIPFPQTCLTNEKYVGVQRALRLKLRKMGLGEHFFQFTWPNCCDLIKRFGGRPNVDRDALREMLQLRLTLDLEQYARLP
ncbi:MAG: hypothetical protein H6999_12190 [Hahellaceae bacterium]|nr:hypothetical protein [Hahellaceae bacterium]MCP5170501.1 hypothetical protein [Hahellaceae bacterium]